MATLTPGLGLAGNARIHENAALTMTSGVLTDIWIIDQLLFHRYAL